MALNNQHHVFHGDDGTGTSNHNASFVHDEIAGLDPAYSGEDAVNAYNQNWDQLTAASSNIENKPSSIWQDTFHNDGVPSNLEPRQPNEQIVSPTSNSGQGILQNAGGFRSYSQPQYDPAIFTQSIAQHADIARHTQSFKQPPQQANTIAPEALQSRPATAKAVTAHQLPMNTSASRMSTMLDTESALPKGSPSGNFLVVDPDSIAQRANAKALSRFLLISNVPQDVNVAKQALPNYVPRKSRNEIRKLLASDSRLRDKLTKSGPGRPPKEVLARLLSTGPSKPAVAEAQQVQHSSTEEESSEEESEYSSSEAEDDPKAPIPSSRPVAPLEAAKYDAIKALWRVPNRVVSAEEVRKGHADFWELVGTIRDRWKSDDKAVKEAEESKKVKDLSVLTERVSIQRNLLTAALKAANEHGHPDILEPLGAHLQFLAAMGQFLLDRAKESDYSGVLPVRIFQLLVRCRSATAGDLERTNITKVANRFAKRGDDRIKSLTKKLTDNSNAATKKKMSASKTSNGSVQSKESKTLESTTKTASSSVAGVKRPLSVDSSSQQAAKRVASGQSSNSPLTRSPDSIKRSGNTAILNRSDSTSSAAAKPVKQKQVTARSSNFFSSLQSASKKPGTSNAEVAAAHATSTSQQSKTAGQSSRPVTAQVKSATQPNVSENKATNSAAPAAQPKSSFSFMETLATLHGPKEAEPIVKAEKIVLPEETDEQRVRRLRKEKRRQLKVRFKPDDALVELHVFSHDPDEELGHDASQTRDVGDVDSEGRMFKLRQAGDMMEIDEDEEDDGSARLDDHSQPIKQPSFVDFSVIDEADREQNYAPHGGGTLEPECLEKEAQITRETSTLGVFYTQSIDIPPSPSEPSDESMDTSGSSKEFGEPPERFAERVSNYGKSSTPWAPGQTQPPVDLAALFGTRTQTDQPQAMQSSQTPNVASATDLEKIFAQFAGNGQGQQHQQPHQQSWGAQEPQPSLTPGYAQNAVQGAMHASQMPQMAPQHAQMPPMSNGMPDLGAVLASLQQPASQAAPQGVSVEQMQADMQMFQNMMSQGVMPPGMGPMMGSAPPQAGAGPYENEERRRWREQVDDSDDVNGFKSRQQPKPWQKKRDGGSEPPKFVVQCKYYKSGKCQKGANCTFRHDD
ncbi:MAG: hypothetical protein M1828_007649 [Chrysothrix sp. TS-e1954]|nr:MAG: hypothetical protein M1828_007649 [Chrysothrix sp. TS-e1954]